MLSRKQLSKKKMNNDAIKKYLSLSAAGRNVAIGTAAVLEEVRRPGKKCVILANDASDRTKKQITDKCAFYNVPLVRLDTPMDELGQRIGKGPTACVAVTNDALASKIMECAESL